MVPFQLYRLGYTDGYEGKPLRWSDKQSYAMGYEQGKEDDSLGKPNKFTDPGNRKNETRRKS